MRVCPSKSRQDGGRSTAAHQGKDGNFVVILEGELRVGLGDAVDEDDFGFGEVEFFEQMVQGSRVGQIDVHRSAYPVLGVEALQGSEQFDFDHDHLICQFAVYLGKFQVKFC